MRSFVFGLTLAALALPAAVQTLVSEVAGAPVKEGEIALYPQYAVPRGEGTPSAGTPPVIPFALMQKGDCYGGYVAGYPVPDTTYAVDMTDAICHADAVEQMAQDASQTAQAPADQEPAPEMEEAAPQSPPGFDPAFPGDLDLQNAVYAAYNAAYGIAVGNPDYVFWDGSDFAPVRDAVTTALADQGLSRVTVLEAPAVSSAAAKACAADGTELRIAFTPDRAGITVAAASTSRVYAYDYDYAVSADLRVTEVRECATSGPGRAGSRSF